MGAGSQTIGRIGRYRLLEHVGSGATATVYRAYDETLRRDVALKVLTRETLAETSPRVLEREARLLARLNHPSVEAIYDLGRHEGRAYLVVEWIPGVELGSLLENGPLDESEVRQLGAQLADGLAAAHGCGVIHRDVKPANIRITPEGRLKIVDFGIAHPDLDATSSLFETGGSLGGVAGTPAYMSPEQLEGRSDARSDLYSAGVVLYEMATGQRPFQGSGMSQVLRKVSQASPRPPRSVNPGISKGLEATILRAMARDPAARFPDAASLRESLNGTQNPPGLRRRRVPRLAIGSAAAALGLLALWGTWWVLRDGQASEEEPSTRPLALREKRLTAIPDLIRTAFPTPDGETIFFQTAGFPATAGLWRRDVRGGRMERVPLPDGYVNLRLSGVLDEGRRLVVYGLLDGRTTTGILDVDAVTLEPLDLGRAYPSAPSPDGRYLLFWRDERVLFHDLETGEELHALSIGRDEGTWGLAWSPDSRWIAAPIDAPNPRIELSSPDGRTSRIPVGRRLVQPGRIVGTAWIAPDRLVYGVASPDGTGSELHEVRVVDGRWDGQPPTRLFSWQEAAADFFSFAEGRLFYLKGSATDDVYVAPLRAEPQNAGEPLRVSRFDGQDILCGWAGSGSVVYASHRNGGWDLFEAGPDGTERPLIAGPDSESCGAQTGDALLYWRVAREGPESGTCVLMRLPSGGPKPQRLAAFGPSWPTSPDYPPQCPGLVCGGERCLLSKIRYGGGPPPNTMGELWWGGVLELDPLTGATRESDPQLVIKADGQVDLSSDGRRLAFSVGAPGGKPWAATAKALAVVDVETGSLTQVPVHLPPGQEDVAYLREVAWDANDEGWYVGAILRNAAYVRRWLHVDEDGRVEQVLAPPGFQMLHTPMPRPDGGALAFAMRTPVDDVWMLEGF